MIYKDNNAQSDTEDHPARRGNELCLNCGKVYSLHYGWRCNGAGIDNTFFSVQASNRYLTQSMKDSLNMNNRPTDPAPTTVKMKAVSTTPASSTTMSDEITQQDLDVSDWKNWVHNSPGECPCGISRRDCTYHK